jgi:hypothetical protein
MPPTRSTIESVEFAAPIGTRVRWATALSLAIVPTAILFNLGLGLWLRLPARTFWPMLLVPTIGFAVVVPVWVFQRILKYRVTPTALEVVRRRRLNRFDLDKLESVECDPRAMEWSLKVFGNDGLGAIAGRFRNRKLGRYEALVTDRFRAVVLRWPERTLVVSPDRPQDFTDAVRARAGLRR